VTARTGTGAWAVAKTWKAAIPVAVAMFGLTPALPAFGVGFDSAPAPPSVWATVGLLGGSTQVDGRLANYLWDTRPRAAWGAQALAGRGRVALGARAWRSQTVQVLDLPAGTQSPAVRSTTLELLARAHVASPLGILLWAGASAGRLRMNYLPDRVVVANGPGGEIVADLLPVGEWIGGAGLSMQQPLPGRWTVGLDVDRQFFSLDTAHRSGAVVIDRREAFSDWSARLEIAWSVFPRVRGSSR
jgi:hypothetical protein